MARKAPAAKKTATPRKSRAAAKTPTAAEVDAATNAGTATPPARAPRPGIDTPTGGFSTDPRKNPHPDTPAVAKKEASAENAEVEAKVKKAEAQGFYGETHDPYPNEAYSLESGPDAPPVNPPRT